MTLDLTFNPITISALLISVGALYVSFQAKHQAKNLGLLADRLKAIRYVQNAIDDVLLHDIVTSETRTSILNAYDIASVAFSEDIKQALDDAYKLSLLCHGPKFDRETEKDWENDDKLKQTLPEICKAMRKEAKV
jgi:hypothetical protein